MNDYIFTIVYKLEDVTIENNESSFEAYDEMKDTMEFADAL